MRTTLPITAAALLLLSIAATPPAAGQQEPAAALPPQAAPQPAAPQENQPNWPAGLQRWNSDDRNPSDGNPNEAEQRGLTSPEVKESQMPEPTQQGTRPPQPTDTKEAGAGLSLYQALTLVRNAPPGLDGRPMKRPNPYASEPEKEMPPHAASDLEHLFPDGYIE